MIAYAAAGVMRREAPDGAGIVENGLVSTLKDLGQPADNAARRVGRKVADAVLGFYSSDGSTATSTFSPLNPSPTAISFIDRWTPEYNVGGEPSSGIQKFLTPQWGGVNQILGQSQLNSLKADVELPEPFLLDPQATYDLQTGTITRPNGSTVLIDDAAIGVDINPEFIAQAQRLVDASAGLTDEQKLIAEFWEDGPGTGFPPGTWIEFGRYASELYDNTRQEDVRMFFGIGQSLLSASVASWGLKTETDYTRPLTAIRELSHLELLRDDDPNTAGVQVYAYNRETQNKDLITGFDWETYQTPGNFYSPPFSEFVSGHSTFSASAGRFIELITGQSEFGGSVTTTSLIEKDKPGLEPVTLSWDSWRDAWQESGQSRIYGGIHFDDGNEQGLLLGERIGDAVFANVSALWA
ncbi:MAG: vanadium-dependent haloperoxidase [Cyanobium sp. CZS 48M]|nr:vanadium-dependent haloperoxidase [Cyanobium sp. CZS48M]